MRTLSTNDSMFAQGKSILRLNVRKDCLAGALKNRISRLHGIVAERITLWNAVDNMDKMLACSPAAVPALSDEDTVSTNLRIKLSGLQSLTVANENLVEKVTTPSQKVLQFQQSVEHQLHAKQYKYQVQVVPMVL